MPSGSPQMNCDPFKSNNISQLECPLFEAVDGRRTGGFEAVQSFCIFFKMERFCALKPALLRFWQHAGQKNSDYVITNEGQRQ